MRLRFSENSEIFFRKSEKIRNFLRKFQKTEIFRKNVQFHAKVDPADICNLYSGMIQVKSRRLYLQELREDIADQKHEKAYTSSIGVQQDCAGGHNLGNGLYRLACGAYFMKWD